MRRRNLTSQTIDHLSAENRAPHLEGLLQCSADGRRLNGLIRPVDDLVFSAIVAGYSAAAALALEQVPWNRH